MSRPTPETKWYVTEYPDECSFAITDGNEILVTIIGGNTIGDQCDLASRIAKLPDLERERDEAIDKYQSLQKTFEEWQLKFLSEQAELLHNKDVERDKLFDEAYQIRIERDEAREEIRDWKRLHDAAERGVDLTIAEGTISDLLKQRDEARKMLVRSNHFLQQAEENLESIYKERDEWKNKAYSHATEYTLMEAKCFRLEQQLKEYDKLKS